MATYFGDAQGNVPNRPFSWLAVAGVTLSLAANVARSVSAACEGYATVVYGALNNATDRAEMHRQAAHEIEALTSGAYWEVDGDDGVFVAALDDIDPDDIELLDDEEDE